jgi:hypothetical protein
LITTFEDAEDYRQFEAVVIADYDAQSAVERELVLRLASLLWRLRRATTMETGLFAIQAEHLREYRQGRWLLQNSRDSGKYDPHASQSRLHENKTLAISEMKCGGSAIELARCSLRLANLPNLALVVSAGTKPLFGAKPARSSLLSMHWIGANRKERTCRFSLGAGRASRRGGQSNGVALLRRPGFW